MKYKIVFLIMILTMTKLCGAVIEGALFRIDDDSVEIGKVFVSSNEIVAKKEPPVSINSITYLCTTGSTYLVLREGNVAKSDPASFDAKILGSFDTTHRSYRFIHEVFSDDGVITASIYILQTEYADSSRYSNKIFISIRGKGKSDIINAIALLSDKMKVSFDVKKEYSALGKNGFGEIVENITKTLDEHYSQPNTQKKP
jgi:hypothetical protein